MTRDEIMVSRDYLVCKSNKLIQDTRYDLSAQQQKIILFLASKIKPEDKDFEEYEFNLDDICDIFGIQKQTENFKVLRDNIVALHNKPFWIEDGDKEILCSWITKAIIDKKKQKVMIQLDKDLKPLLLQLSENYTNYELANVLALDGKYTIRFYELLRSYKNLREITIPLSKLRKQFDCENKYNDFKDFKKRVIVPAIEEINKYTNITVSVEYIKYKKVVVELLFYIKDKKGDENLQMLLERERKLENE